MNAVRIRRKLDSETLHLPELRPLVGRSVEIIVLEEEAPSIARPGTGDWSAAARAVRNLAGYDFDAWREQREFDRQQARHHQP